MEEAEKGKAGISSNKDHLQFSWRRGFKDSSGQGVKCLLPNDFIIVLSILSTSAILERMSAIALLVCNVK